MKTNFKLMMYALLVLFIFNACEKEDPEAEAFVTESSKLYNNGVIKSYDPAMILKWTDLLSLSIDAKMPPPAEARIYAMVTLAIHDALNNIVPKYETYAFDNSEVDAGKVTKDNIYQLADAAVAQAAHDVLTALFPPAITNANILLDESLSAIEDSEFKTKGIETGKAVASTILSKRQNDDIPTFLTYDAPSTDPGVYQADFMPWAVANPNPPYWPERSVYGTYFGDFMPFGIKSGDQFRARPPYVINSPEYTADYNEMKRLGCFDCPDRTDEQTQLGKFWLENVTSIISRMSRTLVIQEELNGWEAARLFALTQMAVIDAEISSFDGKMFYKFWRPVTAIRKGDFDGNDDTVGDLNWNIMEGIRMTPPNPEYPSTHAECGGAAAELLKLFFKKDNISFQLTSPYDLPGVTRTMKSFSQVADECAISRIYIGYHFRNSIEQGLIQGRKLGKYVYENNLQEKK